MKKKLLLGIFMFGYYASFAQNKIFGNTATEVKTEVESLYIPIISIGALIGLIGTYFGTMTGENKDLMKFLKISAGIVIGAVLIGTVYGYLSNASLK